MVPGHKDLDQGKGIGHRRRFRRYNHHNLLGRSGKIGDRVGDSTAGIHQNQVDLVAQGVEFGQQRNLLIVTQRGDFLHAAGAGEQENAVTVRDDDFIKSRQAGKEIRQCVYGPNAQKEIEICQS